jgi:hypothetical protein
MNPFIPFQPAFGSNFLDRKAEQKEVLDRIGMGVSSALVGNPHIGKTSLLRKLADTQTWSAYGFDPTQYALVEFNFELFTSEKTPADFWRQICRRAIMTSPLNTEPLKPFAVESKKKIDLNLLNEAFINIGTQGKRVVVLIDEFDKFLNLSNFATLDFVNPLRAIASNSAGLCLVTASRLSIADLQGEIYKLKQDSQGSPLNFLQPIPLQGFDDDDIQHWMSPHLPAEAIAEVRLLAGRHPLLLQLAAKLLWNEKEAKKNPRWDAYRDEFISSLDAHFRDLWRYLDARAQFALVLMVMRDLEGQLNGRNFNVEKVAQDLQWFTAEIGQLRERAVLEKDANQKWGIGSLGLRLWLIEHKIVAADKTLDIAQWLHNKEFKLGGLITNEEIAAIKDFVQAIPTDLISLAKKVLLPKALQ